MNRRNRLGLRVVGVWLAGLIGGAAWAQTPYYVDDTRPDDTGNGQSWATAKKTIQAAVDLTLANDTVWVTNGTYNITSQISITNGIVVRSVNGPAVTTVQQAGVLNIRIVSLTNANAVLDGFTIRKGRGVDGSGVYMTAGTVTNCIIRDNGPTTLTFFGISGVGVYMTGGLLIKSTVVSNTLFSNTSGVGVWASGANTRISHCVIAYNAQTRDGNGAVYLQSKAQLRNSLVRGNSVGGSSYTTSKGGIYMTDAGTLVENCTIVENTALASGGGIYMNGGAVSNCIVYFNSAGSGANYVSGGSGLAYSCATPLPAGTGNTDLDPLFANRSGGDFHVQTGPARNTGLVLPWMSTSKDLDGNPRLDSNGKVDMGAYQTQPGVLSCYLSAAPPTFGIVPFTMTFNSMVDGTNTSGLGYQWDFTNDGSFDPEGDGLAAPSHTYTVPGRYAVRLVVTNQVGEFAAFTNLNLITATLSNLFVSTTGTSQVPYTNLATAATNFLDAVDVAAAGTRIFVDTGTYAVARSIELTRAITLTGLQGATSTIVQRTGALGFRVVRMTDANAVIEGLMIRNGSGQDGAGVYMTNGTLRNCIVRDNRADISGLSGGGIYMTAGTVGNCVISSNYANMGSGAGVYMTGGRLSDSTVVSNLLYSNGYGAGIYASGARTLVSQCVIADNKDSRDAKGGGVGLAGGATLRNCLVRSNTLVNATWAIGGGIHMTGAGSLVESSTIVGNVAAKEGGGMYLEAGASVSNSIVYFNTAPSNANYRLGGNGFAYSCTTPPLGGTGNLDADPLFVNAATNDYRLQKASPCIDKGTNQAWMADSVDLVGAARIQNKRVDMGAYEAFVRPNGTVILMR